jgi:hypothetical protein
MITTTVTLTEKDRLLDLKNALEEISKSQVYVGIPEEKQGRLYRKRLRRGENVTNPQIAFLMTHGVRARAMREAMEQDVERHSYKAALGLYLHSHGSPLWQIPPRPIIEPAIEAEENKEHIANELSKAMTALLDGKKGQARTHLARAGMEGRDAAVGWFDDPRAGWPPNAPSTKERKGSEHPLIDTGQLKASITYVVRGDE